MSRRSSGTALRVVVILTVLAVLPVLALGSAVMPDSVRDWFSRYWPAVKPAAAPSPMSSPQFQPVPATAVPPLNSTAPWQSGGESAHPFVDARIGQSGQIARSDSDWGLPPASAGNPNARATHNPLARSADPSPAALAAVDNGLGRELPSNQPLPSAPVWGANAPEAAMRRPDDRGSAVMPVSYQASPAELPGTAAATGAPSQYEPTRPMAAPPASASSAAAGHLPADSSGDRNQSEQLQSFQRRLHDLGAQYLLLETWGDRQQLYRCFCKVAIGGNPNCTRHFEATDPDPLRALAVVTEQVEQWQHGQP